MNPKIIAPSWTRFVALGSCLPGALRCFCFSAPRDVPLKPTGWGISGGLNVGLEKGLRHCGRCCRWCCDQLVLLSTGTAVA